MIVPALTADKGNLFFVTQALNALFIYHLYDLFKKEVGFPSGVLILDWESLPSIHYSINRITLLRHATCAIPQYRVITAQR
jgi:hypothetical protein